MANRDEQDLRFKLKEKKTLWDFLTTLKPPEDLSIESGNIYRLVQVAEASPDYEHISKYFISTFGG